MAWIQQVSLPWPLGYVQFGCNNGNGHTYLAPLKGLRGPYCPWCFQEVTGVQDSSWDELRYVSHECG